MNLYYRLLVPFLLCIALVLPSQAQTVLKTRTVVSNIRVPWEILWGPDNWIWMTERGGKISRVNPETGQNKLVFTIPDVYELGESGLLGMALHPGFNDTAQVFVAYTYRGSGSSIKERIVRYNYNGTTLTNQVTLVEGITGNSYHIGCRLLITPDRKLLMTTGDAGTDYLAQSHISANGKVLRMNLDGSVPNDNPFATAPSPACFVWTTGHRNAQGLVLAPNGIIYSSEHGPNNDDEINIIQRRGNYGWPNVMGRCDGVNEQLFCKDSSVVEPLKIWTPTIAPGGIDYYNHTAIPEWRGSLLMVTLRGSSLRQYALAPDGRSITDEKIYFDGVYGRLRDLCLSPDGRVFIATSNHDGRAAQGFPKGDDDKIIEISRDPTTPTLSIVGIRNATADASSFTAGEPYMVRAAVGGTYDAANNFAIQLSNAAGSFSSPRVLQTVPFSGQAGPAPMEWSGTIPCDLPAGTGYRIRIVSSSPGYTSSDNGVNLTMLASPAATITPAGPTTICAGDSVLLRGVEGISNRWSTGDTGTSIVAKISGIYTLNTTSRFNCPGGPVSVTVVVNPKPTPAIELNNVRFLSTETGSTYATHAWYLNDTLIAGSESRLHIASRSGWYRVVVTDSNGCQGESERRFVDLNAGVDVVDGEGSALSLYPQPLRDRLVVDLQLERPAAVSLSLVDMKGVAVIALEESRASSSFRRELSTGGLPAGAYLLTIRSGQYRWSRMVVKE